MERSWEDYRALMVILHITLSLNVRWSRVQRLANEVLIRKEWWEHRGSMRASYNVEECLSRSTIRGPNHNANSP